jgi:hypothetical protein
MDTEGTELSEQFGRELREQERFTAREGNAAAGLLVKNPVLDRLVHNLVHGQGLSHDLNGTRRADLRTGQALCTGQTLDLGPFTEDLWGSPSGQARTQAPQSRHRDGVRNSSV